MSIISNYINLIRRRIVITENLNAIKCLTSINNIYRDSSQIIRIVNLLGKELKTYSEEGKKLYSLHSFRGSDSTLLEDNDSILVEYEEFRIKYGTRKKICTNISEFKRDSQRIIKLLEEALRRKSTIDTSYF